MNTRLNPRAKRGDRRCGAFTLIELLVSAALTVLIAGGLVGLIVSALGNWDRAEATLTTENEARVVLDRLEQDLQAAWNREDGNVWLVATVQADASASGVWVNGGKPVAGSLDHAAPNLADARFGLAGVWLRFFTTAQLASSRESSAPVAVSYQIIRRTPTPSSISCHYLLSRAEVTAAATLTAGYDLEAAPYGTGSDVEGDPGNVVRPSRQQALADNVVDFGIRLFAYAPDATTGTPELRQVFPADASDLRYRAQDSTTTNVTGRPFPAVVDVLVRVLTAEGVRKLAALEVGKISGDWWAIAETNSRVFVRRIQLKTKLP